MNDSKNELQKFFNWKSIAIGIIITFIGITVALIGSYIRTGLKLDPTLELLFLVILILAPIIGGFATAYTNKPKYRVGVTSGALAAVIGLLMFLLSISLITFIMGAKNNMLHYIAYMLLYIFIIMILGISGAFIGTSVKKLKIRS